ncbi:MAG: dihydropteroate synthase [Deltaproteobacteria bacterium]|nr:dihydropteroate synthase [Deltaproteobacteria bacterium]
MKMKPFELVCGKYKISLGKKTSIMGILNVTPDSFSDGGKFDSFENAISHAKQMIEDGAGIIDIGGESTRPFADPVSADDEAKRVVPVIEKLAAEISVPISIDTSKASVAKKAIEAGASIVNDVSAMRDSDMPGVIKESGLPVILMHMKGNPSTMQIRPEYDDAVTEIKDYLKDAVERSVSFGIDRSKIVVDPGIGFGKSIEHNLAIIKRFDEFLETGVPVLLGSSRKSFIQKILGIDSPEDSIAETGTQATVAAAVLKGAHIVRVHNVKGTKATIDIIDSIRNVG